MQERKGKPAIWLEGGRLAAAFNPRDKYRIDIDTDNRKVRFVLCEDGDEAVGIRGAKSANPKPLIEYRHDDLLKVYKVGTKLRVVCVKGKVEISVHNREEQCRERLERAVDKITTKQTIQVGSQYTGGGVLDRALHDGFKKAGIDSYLKVAVESEKRYVEALLANQNDLFRDDSILINSLVEDLEFRGSLKLDAVFLGIPCSGASRAGATKGGLKFAEEHSSVGACFFHSLNFIDSVQPWLVIIENVPPYLKSASYAVITQVLESRGYVIHQTVLNGNFFGNLENRDRMCMVALTKGLEINDFEFSEWVKPLREREASLSMVLDDVSLHSDEWRSYDYLVKKEISDSAAGKGFKRSLYFGDESSVTTIRRLYHKSGSCDQYLVHPENPALFRKFRSSEHSRIKGVPSHVTENISETTAHEILGQGVTFGAFFSLGFGVLSYLQNQCELMSLQRIAA